MKVSVIIKALNEEANIARAIESSLRAVAPFGGEVIVADSVSSDRTVEIASGYPIKIVQLEHAEERCCGIAPQLGYQHSGGEYVYILDGDMELDPEFIKTAIELMDRSPDVAGVGGFIPEMRATNIQFQARMKRALEQRAKEPKDVKCLSGGGLYRRTSVDGAGYLSDRNLHAYEEYDLGTRLRARGWRLVLLPMRAADHYSYDLGTMPLMWHKLKSGAFASQGEIMRAGLFSDYLPSVFRDIFAMRLSLVVWGYWLVVVLALLLLPYRLLVIGGALIGLAAMVAIMTVRHGSIESAVHSVLNWHLLAFCALQGLLMTRKAPDEPIASRVLKSASASDEALSSAAQ